MSKTMPPLMRNNESPSHRVTIKWNVIPTRLESSFTKWSCSEGIDLTSPKTVSAQHQGKKKIILLEVFHLTLYKAQHAARWNSVVLRDVLLLQQRSCYLWPWFVKNSSNQYILCCAFIKPTEGLSAAQKSKLAFLPVVCSYAYLLDKCTHVYTPHI